MCVSSKGSFDRRPSAPAQYCTYTRAAFLPFHRGGTVPPVEDTMPDSETESKHFFRIFGTFSKKVFRLQFSFQS